MSDNLIKISFREAIHEVEVYGLILMDLEGLVVTWNRGAQHLLGFEEAEVLGLHFAFIFTPEDRGRKVPLLEIETALRLGHAYDDRWHVRKDQSQIYVNGGLCLLKTDAGEKLGFVKIIRDQTDKKKRLEEIEALNTDLLLAREELAGYAATLETKVSERTRSLEDRNREIQDFCYSIAHDLRAPLRNIQAMAEVVLEDYGNRLDEKGEDYLRRISRAGQQLDRLTLDLLDYTRFSREEIQLSEVSLEAVVDSVLLNLAESIALKKAEVKVSRPLPSVKGQHAYLEQILGNFLSNALKFTVKDRDPVLEIRAETRNGRVRVYVTDNGLGVATEYHEKIFLLFERLDPNAGIEGTGAGLAIARKAAQRLSGEIGLLQDVSPGSSFWLEVEEAE